MNFRGKSTTSASSSSNSSPSQQPPPYNLNQAIIDIQTRYSNLFADFSHNLSHSLFNPHLHHRSLQTHAKNVLDAVHQLRSYSASEAPVWAQISKISSGRKRAATLSTEDIKERLEGVPVYALSNSDEEFVLLSGASSKKSLGLLCFNKIDAEALLKQMRTMDSGERSESSKVVAVALNKVIQLKVDGVAFRLLPDSTQVKNALLVKEKAGYSDEVFKGVPVFQSQSLILKSGNKSYRPVFFRKEDLEKSLEKASRQQQQLNSALRKEDIQVAVFEEIVHGMKDGASTQWDDVVFVPPDYDVSNEHNRLP